MQRIESLIAKWRAAGAAPMFMVTAAEDLEHAYTHDQHEGHSGEFAVGCALCRDELRELTGPIEKIRAEGIDRAGK